MISTATVSKTADFLIGLALPALKTGFALADDGPVGLAKIQALRANLLGLRLGR